MAPPTGGFMSHQVRSLEYLLIRISQEQGRTSRARTGELKSGTGPEKEAGVRTGLEAC